MLQDADRQKSNLLDNFYSLPYGLALLKLPRVRYFREEDLAGMLPKSGKGSKSSLAVDFVIFM